MPLDVKHIMYMFGLQHYRGCWNFIHLSPTRSFFMFMANGVMFDSLLVYPNGCLANQNPSSFLFSSLLNVLRSTHTRGLVPATNLCNKSRGQAPSCELAIFASKSSLSDWSLVPRIQTSLNFWDKSLRLVPRNASCELFVGQGPVTSPFVETLQGTSHRD